MSYKLEEIENGRWRLTSSEPYGDIFLVRTLEWNHKPTDEIVQYALNYDVSRSDGLKPRQGDHVFLKRIGPFIWGKDVSGPKWVWPKVKLKKWSIHGGWKYAAYWLAWKPRKADNA